MHIADRRSGIDLRRFGRLRIPRRYVIVFIVTLACALSLFHRMAIASIATELRADFGLTAAQLGALGAYYFYPYAFMQIPVGYIVDRWGARRLMATLLVLATLGSFLFALAPSYTLLVIARVLVGLGFAGVFLPSFALLAAWFPASDLTLWTGIFVAASGLGTLAARRPLVELMTWLGWSGAFMLASVLIALTTAAVWLFVRDAPEMCHETPATRVERPTPRLGHNLAILARSPLVWLISAAGFLLAGTQLSFQALWAGPYLADVYGVAPAVIGNLLMLLSFCGMVGNIVSGWLADRLFRSQVLAVLTFLCIYVGVWVMLAFRTADMNAGTLTALYAGYGFFWSPFVFTFAIVRSRFPPEIASTATGVVNLFTMTGGAVLQQVFGVLLDSQSPTAGAGYALEAYTIAFRVSLAVILVGLVAYAIGVRWKRTDGSQTEDSR